MSINHDTEIAIEEQLSDIDIDEFMDEQEVEKFDAIGLITDLVMNDLEINYKDRYEVLMIVKHYYNFGL
jgi:hypothetical protein